ncbi:PREDICTED: uncharacterized protein LOC105147300 isoform X1 [Acromyrmex echinatior]|uniref:Uncharacterized protein n=3 Tax=Attini TaxID=143999 RepID=A0A195EC92_9HYME|nr:PREDICTED: uncharacterized protein LOC105147300 isoform X1 [Acromyrmex echinatior]XP_011056512.1 PREDICTED: uncharacterized protein LOC105147300 isoform X1 [Acromyrmex echinatior]XP_018349288.1 PREDICTED: uncharacterized protein LOC108752741 [Trachymyrmex septentrionalis]XP_018359532.1 PREDICTED: uncharacterized protein LOC108758855 [Trachymyrmex cornetzi]KYN22731.1 hypothetical protein ALC57_04510 [Trachymyrmex cornetzi]
MYWNRTVTGAAREEMPLSSISRATNASTATVEGVNPGTSTQITSTCCTPPPSYHNINLPLGHPSTLTNERGAPPSYEEAIDPNAPPPSYDSLFGRMREARKISKGIFDFLKNIVVLLLGTIGCTIILGVTIVVPICMMVIGGLYLYDCPQGEYIPVYLLVGGGFGVFKQLLTLSARVRQRQEERDEERIRQSPTQTLINCFMLGWFIIGSMWVYKEYEPNYDPALGKYCNKTLYLFAFWLITSVYICMGIITAGLCSISVASIAFQRPPSDLM